MLKPLLDTLSKNEESLSAPAKSRSISSRSRVKMKTPVEEQIGLLSDVVAAIVQEVSYNNDNILKLADAINKLISAHNSTVILVESNVDKLNQLINTLETGGTIKVVKSSLH